MIMNRILMRMMPSKADMVLMITVPPKVIAKKL